MTKGIPPKLQAGIDATVDADQCADAIDLINATPDHFRDPQHNDGRRDAWLKSRQLPPSRSGPMRMKDDETEDNW